MDLGTEYDIKTVALMVSQLENLRLVAFEVDGAIVPWASGSEGSFGASKDCELGVDVLP